MLLDDALERTGAIVTSVDAKLFGTDGPDGAPQASASPFPALSLYSLVATLAVMPDESEIGRTEPPEQRDEEAAKMDKSLLRLLLCPVRETPRNITARRKKQEFIGADIKKSYATLRPETSEHVSFSKYHSYGADRHLLTEQEVDDLLDT